MDRKLQQRQARETGICPVREELYSQTFDELIRQVNTLLCLCLCLCLCASGFFLKCSGGEELYNQTFDEIIRQVCNSSLCACMCERVCIS